MFIKRLILKPSAVVALALFFIFTGTESLIFFSDFVFVDTAEAKKKNKGKDKDKDGDTEGFVFNKNSFSLTTDCNPGNVNRLQIYYHPDFIATDNAPGPNILVIGADADFNGNQCVVTILKVSGGKKCGFKVTRANGKLKIDTINKKNAKNCEMIIKVVAPRTIKILGG